MNGSKQHRHLRGVIPSALLSDFDVRREVACHTVGILKDHGKDANEAGEHKQWKKDYEKHGSSFREVYLPKRGERGSRYI